MFEGKVSIYNIQKNKWTTRKKKSKNFTEKKKKLRLFVCFTRKKKHDVKARKGRRFLYLKK